MWSRWKEVLLPGTQRDARGNEFTVTPEEVRQADANARKMLTRGVPVPCIWEHLGVEAGDDEERRARYAKHTFAHLGGSRVNGRGALELRIDGRDPADERQVLKTRFVSPKLYQRGYADSRGGVYHGATIAHVAATPTPVQFWQRPFELSEGSALYLSFSSVPSGSARQETPEGDAVADESEKGKKGGGEKGKGDGESDGKRAITDVIKALRDIGMNIPEEVADEAGLVIAIKAAGAPKAAAADDGLGELDDDAKPPPGATAGAGNAPMLMSATDPKVLGWSRHERRDLAHRVKRLFQTGRIDRPTAQKLLREAESVQLSYTTAGDLVAPPLATKVAAYEDLPKGSVWSQTGRGSLDLSATGALDHPGSLAGADEASDVVKEQEKLAAQHSVKKK